MKIACKSERNDKQFFKLSVYEYLNALGVIQVKFDYSVMTPCGASSWPILYLKVELWGLINKVYRIK